MSTDEIFFAGKIGTCIAIILALVACENSKCSDITEVKCAVERKGEVLYVKKTVIADKVADAIIAHLSSREITVVSFEDIPGGRASDADRLFRYFPGITVHIKGRCNSACSHLALAAKRLVMLDSGFPESPTSLMIHTPYNIQTGEPSPKYGLNDLNFLTRRFAGAIQREVIAAALTEKRKGNYGLIVVRDFNSILKTPGAHAYECTPYPTDCRPISGSSLENLRIELGN